MSQKRDEPDAPKLTLTFSGAGREIQRKSSKRSSKRDKRSRREVEETEQPVGLALDADAAALAASEGAESELLDIPTPYALMLSSSSHTTSASTALHSFVRAAYYARQGWVGRYGRLHAYAATTLREVSQIRVLSSEAETGVFRIRPVFLPVCLHEIG